MEVLIGIASRKNNSFIYISNNLCLKTAGVSFIFAS